MRSSSGPRSAGRPSWVYSVFPVSLATGPIGTLVQLYLIELNGVKLGTLYASLAVAIFNGVGIPASIFWGFTTDRVHKRRVIVATSYSMMAVLLGSFYFVRSTAGTILMYALFSFASAAAATPLNLLIMETEKKSKWAPTFARLSMMSSIGNVGGLVLSTVWVEALPLLLLSIPLSAFSLTSAALAVLTISEPTFVLERGVIAARKPSFFQRLLAFPMLFITIPRVSDFRRVFRGLRFGLTSYVPLFYISTVLFYLSSGLFNTSFVPAMSFLGISEGGVFAVILSGALVQSLAFQFAAGYIGEKSLVSTSVQGLLVRGACYAAIGVGSFFISGSLFFFSVLVLYPVAAGLAFAFYYTSSNTMMFNTVRRSPGSSLGVYSAVVGMASTAGSLVSGVISLYSGFYATFILAGMLLFGAIFVVSRISGMDESESGSNQ
jgi:MFS family permease